MKNYIFLIVLFANSMLKGQTAYQHTTTAGNLADKYMTTLTHPNLDGNKEAIIIIMPNRNVSNTLERNDAYTKNYGVWYNMADQKWKIFTEDKSAMPLNLVFNVFVSPKKDQNNFSFVSTQQNMTAHGFSHGTLFSNPATDGKEDAIILVTHNGGNNSIPTFDNNSLILSYSDKYKKWGVAHNGYLAYLTGLTASEQSFMKPNLTYNVTVVDAKACSKFNMISGFTNANAFLHTVDASNSSTTMGFISFMDDPKGNNTSSSMVFATPNWGWSSGINCGKTAGPYNEGSICVQYGFVGNSYLQENKWSILNTKTNALPHGMKFNVFIINLK